MVSLSALRLFDRDCLQLPLDVGYYQGFINPVYEECCSHILIDIICICVSVF